MQNFSEILFSSKKNIKDIWFSNQKFYVHLNKVIIICSSLLIFADKTETKQTPYLSSPNSHDVVNSPGRQWSERLARLNAEAQPANYTAMRRDDEDLANNRRRTGIREFDRI